jgi:putative ABC transport system permease protein
MFDTIRRSARALRRDPVLLVSATLTLAVGVGANTTVFSLVDAILLRPLPFPDPGRIYWVGERMGRNPMEVGLGPDYYSLREKKNVYAEVGAFDTLTVNWAGIDRPEQLDAVQATPSFFSVLATRPLLGRTFDEAEQGSKAPPVVVLSYAFWRSRLNADRRVLSRTVTLDGLSYNVIGVMPQGFDYPKGTQIWTTMAMDESSQRPRSAMRPIRMVRMIGRAKAGLSSEQVQAMMPTVTREIRAEYPASFEKTGFLDNMTIFAESLQRRIAGDLRPALYALSGAVVLVLLIACANLANLLLARAAVRRRELAVRMALGSGKGALIRQLLVESCVLALPGGAAGVLLAMAAVRLLNATKPLVLVRYPEIGMDLRTLVFTFGLTVLTGLIFGMAPALGAAGVDLHDALKSGGRAQSASRASRRVRQVLVVAELGVSLVLLIGAGLLAKSFLNLAHVNMGFPAEKLLTLRVNLTGPQYATGRAQQNYYREVLARVTQLPGVSAAAVTTDLPPTGEHAYQGMGFQIAGRVPLPIAQRPQTSLGIVSREYFRALGVPLRAGRLFDSSDGEGSPDAIVVNEAFARKVFPGENPVGHQTVQGPAGRETRWTIIGVVGDVRANDLGAEPAPFAYRCLCQQGDYRFLSTMRVIVRTTRDPRALARAVEAQMFAVDREQPVFDVKTMEERVSAALAPERFQLWLIVTFAGIAIVLAALGVYGVMAYLVTRRTREIGIRIAVGAQPAQVQRLVLAETAVLAVAAAFAGLAGAWGLTRYLKTMLYGVTALDAATFGAAPVVLVIVALGASAIPARRAARVDPVLALREE